MEHREFFDPIIDWILRTMELADPAMDRIAKMADKVFGGVLFTVLIASIFVIYFCIVVPIHLFIGVLIRFGGLRRRK